jgi:hypothetical protein
MNQRRRWIIVLIMAVLLFVGPYVLEIRYMPEYGNLEIGLNAMFWVFGVVGSSTGFLGSPSYFDTQNAILFTTLQVVFLFALFAYVSGDYSRRDTLHIGLASAVPGLFVAAVQISLFYIMGGVSLNTTIPLLFPTIVGLVLLKLESEEQITSPWPEDDNA